MPCFVKNEFATVPRRKRHSQGIKSGRYENFQTNLRLSD